MGAKHATKWARNTACEKIARKRTCANGAKTACNDCSDKSSPPSHLLSPLLLGTVVSHPFPIFSTPSLSFACLSPCAYPPGNKYVMIELPINATRPVRVLTHVCADLSVRVRTCSSGKWT
eukprot:1204258-Pleurochrysis_carterae.AAC.1